MNIKEIINNSKIITPAQIIDLNRVMKNIENIDTIRRNTNCRFYFTLKGFSNNEILAYFIDKFDAISASGLFEARLAKEFSKNVSVFSTAYTKENIKEICENTNYIIFNSINQYEKYKDIAVNNNCSIGIRINPEYSELQNDFGANPCNRNSYLGIRKKDMPNFQEFQTGKIEGIHLHTMCEQGADVLERVINNLISNYDKYLKQIKWLNLGGGQLLGKENYNIEKAISAINKLKKRYACEIILEPCEGIMYYSGYYVTKVIDIIDKNVIVDGSAICHMSDSVYKGWKRDILGEDIKYKNNYELIGCSCYAADSFGNYNFKNKLQIDDEIIFEDTASYTMVKSNMFNGIKMPNLYIIDFDYNIKRIKDYDYNTFKMTL